MALLHISSQNSDSEASMASGPASPATSPPPAPGVGSSLHPAVFVLYVVVRPQALPCLAWVGKSLLLEFDDVVTMELTRHNYQELDVL